MVNAATVNAATECCVSMLPYSLFTLWRYKKDLAHDVVRTQYEVVKYLTNPW